LFAQPTLSTDSQPADKVHFAMFRVTMMTDYTTDPDLTAKPIEPCPDVTMMTDYQRFCQHNRPHLKEGKTTIFIEIYPNHRKR